PPVLRLTANVPANAPAGRRLGPPAGSRAAGRVDRRPAWRGRPRFHAGPEGPQALPDLALSGRSSLDPRLAADRRRRRGAAAKPAVPAGGQSSQLSRRPGAGEP